MEDVKGPKIACLRCPVRVFHLRAVGASRAEASPDSCCFLLLALFLFLFFSIEVDSIYYICCF